ncbi:MAG: ABC transporter permease subunit, partial [Janthinobacterium lividum]
FFITPTLLGGRHETMITQLIIDQVMQALNWGFAGAISVLLLVVVLLVFVFYDRLVGLSTMAGGSAPAGRQRTRRASGKWLGDLVLSGLGRTTDALIDALAGLRRVLRAPLPARRQTHQHAHHDARGVERANARRVPGRAPRQRLLHTVVVALLFFLSAPTFLMIPLSFDSASGLSWPPHGVSLQWYRQVVASPLWMDAVKRSMLVGAGTATLSMLIGTPAAFLLVRGEMRGKAALLAFVLSPIVVPRMIIAVGVFYFFAKIGLIGASFGLVLAHTVVAVPYVVITMMAVLRNYDQRLDQAAHSLGAGHIATLRGVTLPILAAGLMSSFLFAFATSFDELTIALFSSGGVSTTLPKQFWDEITMQISPVIAAVSTALFVFVAVLIWLAERLRRRSERTRTIPS